MQNNFPSSPPVFGRSLDELNTLLSPLSNQDSLSQAAGRLAQALSTELVQLEHEARARGQASSKALAVAKRAIFELLYHVARRVELPADANRAVGELLGRCICYDLIEHGTYQVTQDWFSHNIPIWSEHLAPLRGKANIAGLEIGSFEGLSACYLLENIFTADSSRLICIDPFDGPGQLQAERHFEKNVLGSKAAHRVTKLKGRSGQVLPLLSQSIFDFAYIDGSHHPVDTLQDALGVWPLVKPSGFVIFDDYAIGTSYPKEIAKDIDPKPGIDAFLAFYADECEVIHRGWQLIARKQK